MKSKIVFLSLICIFFTACASKPERIPDTKEKYNFKDELYYEVRMSSEIPYDDFIYAINDVIENNDYWAVENNFFSTRYELWRFYDISTRNKNNVATHSLVLHWEFDQGGQERVFKIYGAGNRNYIEGLGFDFNVEGSKVNKFSFSKVESDARRILDTLDNITYKKKSSKKFSGELLLKNDDVTAFANIQRLHPTSYVSTNSKNDSEKKGSFIVKPYGIKFGFKIYPYKNKSKIEYEFYLPATYTYHSYYIKKENGFYVEKGRKTADVEYEKPLVNKVINSAIRSFNN